MYEKENCNFKEAKLNNSKAKKGNTNAKGYKHSKEAKEKMSAAKIGNTNAKGKKLSDATKAKMSAAKKGTHWLNNGITSIRAIECPPGFTSGRIYKRKAAN